MIDGQHDLNKYNDVLGFLSQEDANTLEYYASESSHNIDGDIIEIGSFKGLSCMIMYHAMNRERKFISVDINSYPEYWNALEQYNIKDQIIFNKCDFRKYDFSKNRYCLAFIDHGHSYEDTIDCFNMVIPFISIGGYVAFHDVGHPHFPGVEKAVTEIKNMNKFKTVKDAFTTVIQKIDD